MTKWTSPKAWLKWHINHNYTFHPRLLDIILKLIGELTHNQIQDLFHFLMEDDRYFQKDTTVIQIQNEGVEDAD